MSSERHSSPPSENNPNRSNYNERKRYKYCCRKCKHAEGGRKTCVCVVPLSHRRTDIGEKGCQTCDCKGCSVEDYISRGEDPEYRPRPNQNDRRSFEREQKFDPKNGCCRKCMKAFSKTGKSCLCQVPKQVRKTKLAIEGCKICSCTGCNPRDHSSESIRSYSRSHSQQSSSIIEQVDEKQYNFGNIDRSLLGKTIVYEYSLYPGMLGMGIPQRTPNYILGKPI